MKAWMRPQRVEWLSFLLVVPFLCTWLNFLLFGRAGFGRWQVWVYSLPLIALQALCSWYIHITFMHWLRVQFPKIRDTSLRLTILAVVHVCMIAATFASLFYAYDVLHFLDFHFNLLRFRVALLSGIGLTMIATTLWEADYTFKQWKDSLAEKEKLEQLRIQQEFDSLKSQVNPHFLFNCFNTLSSLISEDRKQAERFLNELSKVYRYLLRNNEDGLSTLQTELRFITSYYQLLQTRHGAAVLLQIETDKKYNEYLLPSLSLQLLVENAVKHNVLSRNKPLMIEIFTTSGNKLVVSNNFQPRTVKGPSNGIGLDNIRTKYTLLNHQGFQVLKNEKSFSVVLPLIWNKVNEKITPLAK